MQHSQKRHSHNTKNFVEQAEHCHNIDDVDMLSAHDRRLDILAIDTFRSVASLLVSSYVPCYVRNQIWCANGCKYKNIRLAYGTAYASKMLTFFSATNRIYIDMYVYRDLDTPVSWHSWVSLTCVICLDLIAFCSSSMMATHLSLSVSFSVRMIMSMLTLEQPTEEQDTCNRGGKARVARFHNWKGQNNPPQHIIEHRQS